MVKREITEKEKEAWKISKEYADVVQDVMDGRCEIKKKLNGQTLYLLDVHGFNVIETVDGYIISRKQ